MSEKLSHIFLAGLGLMLFAGFLFLAGRFVLPWTAPLLTAWVLAALLEPAVSFLVRHRCKRGGAAGLCTLAVLGLLLWGLTALLMLCGAFLLLIVAIPGAYKGAAWSDGGAVDPAGGAGKAG